jgi:hypothetical protein
VEADELADSVELDAEVIESRLGSLLVVDVAYDLVNALGYCILAVAAVQQIYVPHGILSKPSDDRAADGTGAAYK